MNDPEPGSPTFMSRTQYEQDLIGVSREYDYEFLRGLTLDEYISEPDLSPNRTAALTVLNSEEWEDMWDPVSLRKQVFMNNWEDNSTPDAFFIAQVGRECHTPEEMQKFLDSLTPRKEVNNETN